METHPKENRRRFIQTMTFGSALFTTRGLFAETLTQTASLTEGPFYPYRLPLDTDNDLLIIVIGSTAQESEDAVRGGISRPERGGRGRR